jgi:hypothetical protein
MGREWMRKEWRRVARQVKEIRSIITGWGMSWEWNMAFLVFLQIQGGRQIFFINNLLASLNLLEIRHLLPLRHHHRCRRIFLHVGVF